MRKIQILAILFALITGIAVYVFFNSLQNKSTKDYVQIVVATKHIDMKTQLTADMLTYKKIPAEAVQLLAVRNIAEVIGSITQDNLETDEPLLSTQIVKSGKQGNGLAYMVPNGCRAETIAADDVSGVSGFLKAGDMVDVLVEIDTTTPSGNKTSTSVMLLQNIEVLATGTSAATSSSTAAYTTVTLVVTPDQSLKLDLADTQGKIRLTLRSPLDRKNNNEEPQTLSNII